MSLSAMLTDPNVALGFYGSMVAVVLFLGWQSKDIVAQKLAFLMLVGWTAVNVAVAVLGFERAPLAIPTILALVAVLVAVVAVKDKSKPAGAIVSLFALEIAVHVWGYLTHREGSFVVYLGANVVFVLRMLVAGGWAGARLADRLGRERERTAYRASSGP